LTRTSFRILKSAQSDSYSTFNQLMVVHVPKEVSGHQSASAHGTLERTVASPLPPEY
jgi:hypothetical protein